MKGQTEFLNSEYGKDEVNHSDKQSKELNRVSDT